MPLLFTRCVTIYSRLADLLQQFALYRTRSHIQPFLASRTFVRPDMKLFHYMWTPLALRGLQTEIWRCTQVNITISTNMNWRHGHSQTTTTKLHLITVIFMSSLKHTDSRDYAVSIATGYRLDDRGVGVRVPVGQKCLFPTSSKPSLLSHGYRGLFPRGGKAAGTYSWSLTSN
jgi:hypothetical protein